MRQPARIILVGRQDREQEVLAASLVTEGFEVTAVAGGAPLRAALSWAAADVVLLEADLGGEDSLALLRMLARSHPQIGVILLAEEGAGMARVAALDAGADDIVSRPVRPAELLARVRSVLRRLVPPPQPGRLRVGRCLVDLDRRELLDGAAAEPLDGEAVALLRDFTANPYRPLEVAWLARTTPEAAAEAAIARQVEALRRKVERDPARPLAIRTVSGVGYMFVPEAE